MGGGSWCCCACFFWSDDFDRAIGTDIGGDWDEAGGNGNWEIAAWSGSDHILYEPGTGNSWVLSTQPVPVDSDGEMSVEVDILTNLAAFTTGDIFYLFAACADSSTKGVEAKFTKTSTALEWTVEISKGGTSYGSKDMVSSDTTGLSIHANLCVDSDGEVRASITSTGSEPVWVNVGATTGRYHGLGHDNTATGGRFNDYAVVELRRVGKICDYCWCPCLDQVPDKSLVATFTDATDRSACLSGDTIDMDWNWNVGVPSWDGIGTGVDMDSFTLKLVCAQADSQDTTHPGKNFTLFVNGGGASQSCCRSGCEMIPLTTSTCDPLNLVFGPFTMTSTDLVCDACYAPLAGPASGEYYIVITDR